jgi:Glycosyltransferase 61
VNSNKFFLSSNYRKLRQLEIISSDFKTTKVKIRRKLKPAFLYYFELHQIEYANNLGVIKLFLVSLRFHLDTLIFNPSLFFKEFLYVYTFELPSKVEILEIKVNGKSINIWKSKQVINFGYFTESLNGQILLERIRNSKSFDIFLIQVNGELNSTLGIATNLPLVETKTFIESKIENQEFKNAFVVGAKNIYIEGQSAFASIFLTCPIENFPSDKILRSNDSYIGVFPKTEMQFKFGNLFRITNNWYHFLFEDFPIILDCFQSYGNLKSMVVNIEIPNSIIDVLDLVSDQNYIRMGNFETLKFDTLKVNLGKKINIHNPSENKNEILRVQKFFDFLDLQVRSEFSRVFITRPENVFRKLLNRRKVIAFLKSQGFFVTDLSGLGLKDQISIFAGAELIVIESGASCSNLIFCKKSARISLIQASENEIYFWEEFCQILGLSASTILGKQIRFLEFIGYTISLKMLRKLFLKKI